MNCADAQELLSAYCDGEVSDETESNVNVHLSRCVRCAEELAAFKQLSTSTRGLQTPQTPDSMWDRLETRLDEEFSHRPRTLHRFASLITAKPLALAATLLVALGLAWFAYGTWFGHGGHHEFAAEFDQYLEAFHRDPDEAQQMLLAKYDGQTLDPTRATQLVGYRPATANSTHKEYRVKSTHVLQMPCCKCVQTVCERTDGSTVVIFEHDDENPEWFGDQRETMANCSGKRCRLFDIQDRIAASWKSGNRHITAIGVRDASEVSDLVSWLKDRPQRNSS